MRPLAAAVLAAALVLTACGGDPEPAPTPVPETTPPPSPSPTDTETDPAAAFPLTGVATDDPRLEQPIVAVKIENTAAARPQAGLEAADVVYEELVEGGITRFNALYHSQLPTEVGPVRSGRPVDVDILSPLGSIFVYSGARPDVTDSLVRAPIALLADTGPPVFSRAPDRPGSHDLMADLPAALEAAGGDDEAGPVPADWLVFDEQPPAGGEPADELTIRMSGASHSGWEWDEAEGLYRRLQNGSPQEVTGQGVVGAANVVVLLTETFRGGCCDTAGNPFLDTRFAGDGDGLVLRDGEAFEIHWDKPSVTDHVTFTTADGKPFPLAPGPTWIHLAPLNALPEPEA